MQIFFPKEEGTEIRATILPEVAKKFTDLGIKVVVETEIGSNIFLPDESYRQAGAIISTDRLRSLSEADIVCRINKPKLEEISSLKRNSIHVSFLDPFNEKALVNEFAQAHISAISMELVPRITRS